MNAPPPLPRNVAELEQWKVYADELAQAGDPRAEGIALDLALPTSPTKEQLEQFRAVTKRTWKLSRDFEPEWMLGFVTGLAFSVKKPRAMNEFESTVDEADLARLEQILRRPELALLQTIQLKVGGDIVGSRRWKACMTALPLTCERFELPMADRVAQISDEFLAALPAQVTTLVIGGSRFRLRDDAWRLVSQRLRVVDFQTVDGSGVLPWSEADVWALRVRLELFRSTLAIISGVSSHAAAAALGARIQLGVEGDGWLVQPETGAIHLVRQRSLRAFQRRYGLLPAAAQLRRTGWHDTRPSAQPKTTGLPREINGVTWLYYPGEPSLTEQ